MKQFTYDKALPEGRTVPKPITPWRIVKLFFALFLIILGVFLKMCSQSTAKIPRGGRLLSNGMAVDRVGNPVQGYAAPDVFSRSYFSDDE
jgi:hypothetical protein